MKPARPRSVTRAKLPATLRELFWDYDFAALHWQDDHDLITMRILASGSWDAVTWLRLRLGNHALRERIEQHEGRGLSPRQLRFWELILGLSHRQVDTWLAREERQIWDKRARP